MRSSILALLALALAIPAAAEGAEPSSLLILDFKHEPGDENTARLLNDLVATAAERTSSLKVITGADIANVVALEAEKEALGCDDTSASCLAEVAGAMGADLVLFGNVGRLGEVFVVTLNLFNSEKAQSAGRATVRAKALGEMPDKVERAVADLLRGDTGEPAGGPFPVMLATGAAVAGVGAVVGGVCLLLANGQNEILVSKTSTGDEKAAAFLPGHLFFWSGVAGVAAAVGGVGLMFLPEGE